jgi:hypothetical protein
MCYHSSLDLTITMNTSHSESLFRLSGTRSADGDDTLTVNDDSLTIGGCTQTGCDGTLTIDGYTQAVGTTSWRSMVAP